QRDLQHGSFQRPAVSVTTELPAGFLSRNLVISDRLSIKFTDQASLSASPRARTANANMGKLRKQTADAVGGETRHDVFNDKVLDLAHELLSEGRVEEGMRELMAALWAEKLKGSPQEWKAVVERCVQHPLRDLLHEDPFTRRAYRKPRGYPGDAVLLDYIYGREERWSIPEGTSELGHKIFEYTTRTTACEGVRARRGYIADLLDELAQKVNRPHVLAIAAGHLREAILCAAVKRRRLGRYVALDADRESMAEIERCYGAFGVETV